LLGFLIFKKVGLMSNWAFWVIWPHVPDPKKLKKNNSSEKTTKLIIIFEIKLSFLQKSETQNAEKKLNHQRSNFSKGQKRVYYDWPKPRLPEEQLAENHNWPTTRLAEITIGRKQASGPPLARARYGPPARFRLISSIFAVFLLYFCVLYSTTVLFTLELWKMSVTAMDCHEWLKNCKNNGIARKNHAARSSRDF
jgi:hypothetical protein